MHKIQLNKVILKRIFLVFIVGLVSRSAINLILDVNVCMEYSCYISMMYYSFMLCVSAVVCEIPSISVSVFNIRLIKDSIISYFENRDVFEEKMGCDVDGSKSSISKSTGRVSDDYLSHSHNSSGEKGHGTRKVSAGVSGLYGNSSSSNGTRVRRPSAGLRALYGDRDEYNQTSSRSSTSTRESNRDRRHQYDDSRDRRRHENSPIDVRDIRVVREPTVNRAGGLGYSKERVSGFKTADNTVPREDYYYIVPENQNLRDIEKFALVSSNPNGGHATRGGSVNSNYAPSEVAITLGARSTYQSSASNVTRDSLVAPRAPRMSNLSTPETMSPLFSSSEYQSSVNNGTTDRLVAPRAPRITNYATPDTMSPLFPPSETSSRRSYSTQRHLNSRNIVSRHWDSFYSKSPFPVASVTSYDTDIRNVEHIKNKLREAKIIITDNFSPESSKSKGSSKGRGLFTRRK